MSAEAAYEMATNQFAAKKHQVLATLRFTGEEFFFQGHFPGRPVLPAFVQLDCALHLASRALGRRLAMAEVSRAVFKSPTGPGRDLRFEIALSPAEDEMWKLKCEISEGAASVAEFTLRVR